MSDESPAIQQAMKSIKLGTSAWTTLRWLSHAVHAACWIAALPVELLVNRRMGRRYTALLPFVLSLFLLGVLFTFVRMIALQPGQRTPTPPTTSELWVVLLFQCAVILSLFRHRFANWVQFRTNDQVHSLSCGIPFWLNPPQWVANKLSKIKVVERGDPSIAWDKAIPADAKGMTLAIAAAQALAAHVMRQIPPFLREWKSGKVPTGPIMWFGATVVQPLLVLGSALVVGMFSGPLSFYLLLVAVALFFKARIEKAFVVEQIYDLFDTRIEQRFVSALSNPQELAAVERTGVVVPGIARMAAASTTAMQSPTSLAPDLAKLIDAKLPQVAIEVRPQAMTNGITTPDAAAPER